MIVIYQLPSWQQLQLLRVSIGTVAMAVKEGDYFLQAGVGDGGGGGGGDGSGSNGSGGGDNDEDEDE
jgi:hypothetical protein